MARWIPPIPKAAMYRSEAIRLGEALPLLFYCYDCVDRAGWVSLKLSVASDILNIPYPTLKHWWQTIERTGVFFDAIDRRGRAGLRVHFAPDWLDWSMPDGYRRPDETGSQMIPKDEAQEENGQETGSDVIPNTQNEQGNGIENGQETGSHYVPNVLHIGTHVFSSSNDNDMRPEEVAPHSPDQPSSSPSLASLQPEEKPLPNGTPEPPPPVPLVPSPELWAALDEDGRHWLKQTCQTPNERRRLAQLVEQHGLAFVAEGIHACVAQSGRALRYLETMCAACAERGTTPGQSRTSSAVAAPSARPAPPAGETEEQRLTRIANEIRAKSGTISYHGGIRGSLTA